MTLMPTFDRQKALLSDCQASAWQTRRCAQSQAATLTYPVGLICAGGTEARVGLVCCRGDTEQLCSELEVEIRDRKIAVFGRQDLPQLGQKFAKWVESNG